MKLDPGSTHEQAERYQDGHPRASCGWRWKSAFFTAFLLGLGMHALGGLHTVPGDSSGLDVDAPRYPWRARLHAALHGPGVRRPRARAARGARSSAPWWPGCSGCCCSPPSTPPSADLITIQFLMSRDGEMPPIFKNLNRFGVPLLGCGASPRSIPVALVLAGQRHVGPGRPVRRGRRRRHRHQPGRDRSTDRKMVLTLLRNEGRDDSDHVPDDGGHRGFAASSTSRTPGIFALTVILAGGTGHARTGQGARRTQEAARRGAPAPPSCRAIDDSRRGRDRIRAPRRSLATTAAGHRRRADARAPCAARAARWISRSRRPNRLRRPLYLLFVREQTDDHRRGPPPQVGQRRRTRARFSSYAKDKMPRARRRCCRATR